MTEQVPLTYTTEGWRLAYKLVNRTMGQHELDDLILDSIKQIGVSGMQTAFFPPDVAERIFSAIVNYDEQWRFIDEWE